MKHCYSSKKLLSAIFLAMVVSGAYSEGNKRPRYLAENSLHQPNDVIIRGTIRDENNPLTGATVREEGTSNVTVTKADGTFTIRVSKPDAVLTISFVGYQSTEIALEGRTQIVVTLKASSQQLSNVVITALGITCLLYTS